MKPKQAAITAVIALAVVLGLEHYRTRSGGKTRMRVGG